MRKPGDAFGFRPINSLASPEKPRFAKPHHPGEPEPPRLDLTYPPRRTIPRNTDQPFTIFEDLPSTRDMVHEHAPPKLPPRTPGAHQPSNIPTSPSSQGYDGSRPSSSMSSQGAHHRAPPIDAASRPAIKAKALASLDDKYANLFIQPKNRPEHHRPQRINGPLGPSYKDKKVPTAPGQVPGSSSNPITVVDHAPISRYSQPGVFSQHVDPKKAAENIKALLEGAMEEEDEGEDAKKVPKDPEEEDKRAQIEGLKVRLLPHQVEGVEWMRGRELGPVKKGKVPKGGLLADDMGLGKTLQSISLLLTNAKPSDKHAGVEKSTLVVAPLALIRQWEAELKDKVEESHWLKVLVHHGPQRTKRFEDLRKYDVVITTYQILVSEHGQCTPTRQAGCFGLHWYRVILDEAHTIKNRNAKATKACYELRSVYRWCLSGTPMQNNLEELQSLVKFLRIKPYDNLNEWKEHFENPIKQGQGDVAMQRLHAMLSCFMKRRTKEILKKVGALDTGGKKGGDQEKSATSDFKVTERKVVSIAATFSPAERRFYNRLERRTDKSIDALMQGNINYASALVLLLRLRQACNHPKLLEGKLEKDHEALSDEPKPKKVEADVDALADLLGGLDVATKHCDICGWEIDKDSRQAGRDKCKDCYDDLQYFRTHDEGANFLKTPKPAKVKTKTKSKKAKVKKVVVEKIKLPTTRRKPRNRRAVIDSSDEEEEGSWIVSGDEKGPLRLGKAGGTDDENAEGDGETIHTEDDEDDDTQEGSQLDSFVVDDGQDTKPEYIKKALEDSDSESDSEEDSDDDSDDDLPDPADIARRVAKSKSGASKATRSSSDSDESDESEDETEDEDTGVSESELDSDSGSDAGSNNRGGQATHVLASAKIRQLLTILHKEVREHKFIVFSQFTSMLDLVEPFFRKDGIKYTRYDGSMRNDAREAALDSLRNDSGCRVLLCSLKCGALGLNLTAASRVVILEPFWNPFVEEQAIDRVHRLTQKVDVVVYKLTVEDTVEERILELQDKKRALADAAIEGAAGARGPGGKQGGLGLGLKEMIALFKHAGRDGSSGGGGGYDLTGDDRNIFDDVSGTLSSMRSKKNMPKSSRNDHGVYGRRW
ncbi:transcription termination factor 2 [Microdochium nivale]|nr:transcription termination factor 2 [Microdochium nivale]